MFSLGGERGLKEDTSISSQFFFFYVSWLRAKLHEKKNKFHVHIKQGKLVLPPHCLGDFKGSVPV